MGTFIDLTGQRFGRWTVIERDHDIHKKNIYWKCRCDCGTIRSVAGTSLRSGISVSCGCEKDEKTSMRTLNRVDDLTGQRFGMWTVIRRDTSKSTTSKRGARWICRCDYDFAFYIDQKLKYLIECQGQQHYTPVGIFGGEEQFAKQQLHDELKKEYAASIGVKLIEIPYYVDTYENTKELLASFGL